MFSMFPLVLEITHFHARFLCRTVRRANRPRNTVRSANPIASYTIGAMNQFNANFRRA